MFFFQKPLLRLALYTFTIYLTDIILLGFTVIGGFWGYVAVALFLVVLHVIIRPILKVVSLPFILVTFGAFILLINAFMLYLAEYLLDSFEMGEIRLEIEGVLTYIVAAFVLSLVHMLLSKIIKI